MEISVRKADLSDALPIVKILTDAVQYKTAHDDMSLGSEPFSEREVRGLIKTASTYVVFINDELVATFGLGWEDERIWGTQANSAGYVHRLAVKKNQHGHNIGGQIIEWIGTEVARHGHSYLRLDCDARNPKLCSYYEKHGFKKVGEKLIPSFKDYFANLYEKPLN